MVSWLLKGFLRSLTKTRSKCGQCPLGRQATGDPDTLSDPVLNRNIRQKSAAVKTLITQSSRDDFLTHTLRMALCSMQTCAPVLPEEQSSSKTLKAIECNARVSKASQVGAPDAQGIRKLPRLPDRLLGGCNVRLVGVGVQDARLRVQDQFIN